MEEEDIESWYSNEMQQIADSYKEYLRKHRNLNIEKEREKFRKQVRDTIAKYHKMQHKRMDQIALKKKLHSPVEHIRDFMDQLSSMFNERDE